MLNFIQSIKATQTVKERARILKDELSGRRKEIERLNGGLILDINEYEGPQVGDKVRYINALGQTALGYLSHFFMRMQETHELKIAEMCRRHLAQAEGRPYEKYEQSIIPVIVPEDGFGYSTHNGSGLPEKIN